MFERIQAILDSCTTDTPVFPPTELYNETWLLRLVLDWFSQHDVSDHFLSMPEGGRWFSEAWLPSAFLRNRKGDKPAESWTHADGVVGHFHVGERGKADVGLDTDATYFVVVEAKMFSRLSSGVTHASYYDQAARTVACIAEVLRLGERPPSKLATLGFYVLAPTLQIERQVFEEQLEKRTIREKVRRRVDEYSGAREEWYSEWFLPTLERIDIDPASWETLIATIGQHDPVAAASIHDFYRQCIRYCRPGGSTA